MNRILFLAGIFWLTTGIVSAADRASETDMFGGTKPVATPDLKEKNTDKQNLDTSKSNAGKTAAEETLQIGGTLSTEADMNVMNGTSFFQNTVSNPNVLFLYLDSKLESDSRVFARGRLFYDPTGVSGGNPNTVSFTNPYGLGNGNSDNLNVSLQELRISANIDEKVFFTIGRQKVKYGVAKFFNPTDFLNSQLNNFLLPSDERPGVDMVKVHIPSGIANFYAVGLVGNPSSGNPKGGYFRSELGYDGGGDFLGSGEMSFSGFFPMNQPGRGGFDISQAVGDFDLYFEGAVNQDLSGNWQGNYSAGAGWAVRYGDRASNTLSLQGEYGKAVFFGDYGAFSLALPEPGSLTHITFAETNVYSWLFQAGFSRLDIIYQFTTQITGRVYASVNWGQQGGVTSLASQAGELGTRMDVNF